MLIRLTISTSSVKFITFNYDRSLQYLLFHSLKNTFKNISEEAIQSELANIPIIHIYGNVAPMAYVSSIGGHFYGMGMDNFYAPDFVENIEVMYDSRNQPQIPQRIEEARQFVHEAKRIFFLGFGYDRDNLKQLSFPQVLRKGQEIYGTAKDLEEAEILRIKKDLGGIERTEIEPIIEDTKNITLLRRYLTEK